MITIFFGGKLGILGGSFYASNTLDRTLLCVLRQLLLFSSGGSPGHFELKIHTFRKKGFKIANFFFFAVFSL